MSHYCLYCTVCKHYFNSSSEWNTHLPEINHQRRAQLQCRKWTAFNKESVIVVFGTCPVVDCGLIQILSGVIEGNFVTDFIHWKKKPNIGLIQFESSESVDNVLSITGPQILIDDVNRVQLRKALDYFDLEWNYLFSLSAATSLESSSCNENDLTQNTTTIEKEKVTKKKKARKLTTDEENPEVNAKNKKRKEASDEHVFSESRQASNECRTNDKETRKKKTKKAKVSSERKEDNTLIPRKKKKLQRLENDDNVVLKPTDQNNKNEDETSPPSYTEVEAVCNATEEVEQSICEETFTAVKNATPDLETSEASPEPELSEEREALDSDQTNHLILPVPEMNAEMQTPVSTSVVIEGGSSCSPANADQSDTNSTDTEVVILSSDESDEENNIIVMSEVNSKDDREQQNHIPISSSNDDAKEENSVRISFRKQYIALLQDILIPKDEFENALNLIEMMESEFKKTVPECRIIPFRHWHLGIKSAGTNDLLLYLDHSGIWGKDEWNEKTYNSTKPFIISKFFRSPELVFPDVQKISKGPNDIKSVDPNKESFGFEFLHVLTGLKFRVIDKPLLLHEVQTSRLIQYLCEFDPVVLPLLGLVNYWANVNSLMFGNLRVTSPSNPFASPFPTSLNWLVLLFLMSKKVIPSPRKILSEPHKKIIYSGTDLGFSDDSNYPTTWSGLTMKPLKLPEQITRLRNTNDVEMYSIPKIVRMFQILKDFFTFYRAKIRKRGYHNGIIFNSKDGNILTKSQIANSNKKLCLDNSEREILKEKECFIKHDVSILHPIDFSKFSLSFNSGIFKDVLLPLMELTRKKLRKFIISLRKGKFQEMSVSQLFKVNRDDIKEIGQIRPKNAKKMKSKPKGKKKVKSKNKKKICRC